MFGIKERLQEFENAVVNKTTQLEHLEMRVSLAKQELAALEAKTDATLHKNILDRYKLLGSSAAAIDWATINAFSIERTFSSKITNLPVTVVGYMVNTTAKEWTLYIDEKQHDALVEEFKAYVKAKKSV